jgi:hypothetical protein
LPVEEEHRIHQMPLVIRRNECLVHRL